MGKSSWVCGETRLGGERGLNRTEGIGRVLLLQSIFFFEEKKGKGGLWAGGWNPLALHWSGPSANNCVWE